MERTYTTVTVQAKKRGSEVNKILVVENVFGDCSIENHSSCQLSGGYDVMLTSNCVAICSCNCHAE